MVVSKTALLPPTAKVLLTVPNTPEGRISVSRSGVSPGRASSGPGPLSLMLTKVWLVPLKSS